MVRLAANAIALGASLGLPSLAADPAWATDIITPIGTKVAIPPLASSDPAYSAGGQLDMTLEQFNSMILTMKATAPGGASAACKNADDRPETIASQDLAGKINKVYEDTQRQGANAQENPPLNPHMLEAALEGFAEFKRKFDQDPTHAKVTKFKKFVMVDHSQCSAVPRFFVVTLGDSLSDPPKKVEVMKVASGSGTDPKNEGWDDPRGFHDVPEKHTSELGFFAAVPHQASDESKIPGKSLALEGLSGGLNENSEGEGKLIHVSSKNYVTDDHVGRSEGCQTLDLEQQGYLDQLASEPNFMDFSYFNLKDQNDNKTVNKMPKCSTSPTVSDSGTASTKGPL